MDVFLIVEDTYIPAHRLILCAANNYFYRIMKNDPCKVREIIIDSDKESIRSLVDFFYFGEIELREDNVENLLDAADLLEISEVAGECRNFISFIRPNNCSEKTLSPRPCGSTGGMELYEMEHKHIIEHFTDVTYNEDYLNLYAEDREPVSEVKMAAIDHENTLDNSLEVKPLSPLENVIDNRQIDTLFCDNFISQCSTKKTRKRRLKPKRNLLLSTDLTMLPPIFKILFVGGHKGYENTNEFSEFDVLEKSWFKYDDMPSQIYNFGVALIHDKLFAVGGEDNCGRTLNITICFDFSTKKWTEMQPMNKPRRFAGMGVLDSDLYAIGGIDKGFKDCLKSAEKLSWTTRQWSDIAQLKDPRCLPGVAALNGRLYVFGGHDGKSFLKSAICFHPDKKKWVELAPMLVNRKDPGVVALNGFLYVVGGYDRYGLVDSIERYDPEADSSIFVESMHTGRSWITVFAHRDYLFAAGSCDTQSSACLIVMYNPETDIWKEVGNFNCKRLLRPIAIYKNT